MGHAISIQGPLLKLEACEWISRKEMGLQVARICLHIVEVVILAKTQNYEKQTLNSLCDIYNNNKQLHLIL